MFQRMSRLLEAGWRASSESNRSRYAGFCGTVFGKSLERWATASVISYAIVPAIRARLKFDLAFPQKGVGLNTGRPHAWTASKALAPCSLNGNECTPRVVACSAIDSLCRSSVWSRSRVVVRDSLSPLLAFA